MKIEAKQVKELRDLTGAGMMDCKHALVETEGDIDKAIDYLREKGITKAAKKSSRIASEGIVTVYVSEDNKKASMIEVNSETDFVAKNEEFVTFANKLAEIVANENPKNVEELKGLEYEDGKTVEAILTEKIATIGENMSIRRFERIETEGTVEGYIHANGKIGVIVEVEGDNREVAKELCLQITALNPEYRDVEDIPAEKIATIGENMSIRRFERIETEGTVEGYIHANGKIGVIVEVEGDNREVAKELCLQITALNPEYRDVEDIPAERVEKEKEVLAEQAKEEGKPEEIAKKIAEGRLGKFYEEVTLVNQVYVKDSSKKIKDILKENNTNVISYYR